ncbi:MAG: flagellar export protein FliJ [Thermodesulfobacteriota bacterium]
MKRYRFRFETLLHFRGHVEELLMTEYRLLKSSVEQGELSLDALVALYDCKADELTQLAEVTPVEFLTKRAFIGLIKERIGAEEEELYAMRSAARLKQEELLEASKARKVLDIVKEREARQHREAVEKEEQAALDEYALRCSRKGVC